MTRAEYIDRPCKTALNPVKGMPFRWSLNPYRGCVHACQYCYARASHPFLGFNAGDEFETRIIVKANMPDVLRRELAGPNWTGEQVAIGTVTDAYQPIEGKRRITRALLEVLLDYGNPASIITKSTLIKRDLDLWAALARQANVLVSFTITTVEPALWRLIEPGTPPPAQRLRVMAELAAAGVPCGLSLAPVLPGLTDSDEAIRAVASAARAHGATSFWAGPLRLAPLVREHYFDFVRAAAPHLLRRYQISYPAADPPRDYRDRLEARLRQIRTEVGFHDRPVDAAPATARAAGQPGSPHPGQLVLPL